MFYFDVSIKSEDLTKVKIKEMLVEWGGDLLSQEPPRYLYDNTLIFDEITENSYYKKYYGDVIGEDFDLDKYRTFTLPGCLNDMESLINFKHSGIENTDLYKFLADLSELDDFAIFLIRDEEYVDVRYRVNTKDELIDLFCDCLKWDSPRGALITKL